MIIKISSLHLKNTKKTKEYAYKKVNKLKKFHSEIEEIFVRLISQKAHRGQENDFSCEITIHVSGKVLEIVDRERDIDKAIDKATERAKRVLIKSKEKIVSKKHKAAIRSKRKIGS